MPSTPYTPILGTLGYVWDRATDSILMVHRVGRLDDEQFGKYNGLGGKLERNEDVAAGMRRELREEADIEVTSMRLAGTVNWPGFGRNGEDWFGFVFVIDGWTGTPPTSNVEGTLEWVPRQRVLQACSADADEREGADLPMWEGDRWFLPLVLGDDATESATESASGSAAGSAAGAFHGVMPYAGGRPTGWTVERWS